jgi:ABC-type branched-subunit amino acid transport system permease subunit
MPTTSNLVGRKVLFLAVLILSLNLPLLLPYGFRLIEQIILYSLLTLIWAILYKFLGLFFLGISGIVGLSIYLVSILHQFQIFVTPMDLFSASVLMVLILAPLTYLVLRTSGGYFALLTLGLNLIFPLITSSLDSSYFRVSARYLYFDIEFYAHFILLALFFILSFLWLYLHMPVKLKNTLILIKRGKEIAESLGINFVIYRYFIVLLLLIIMAVLGVIHSTYLFRVDTLTVFPAELTLIPLTAGLLIVIKTRGDPLIDIIISLLVPLLYILFGIGVPALVEVLLGLLIFGALAFMFKKMLVQITGRS